MSEVKRRPVLSSICSETKVNGLGAHSWEIELGGLAPPFELTSSPEIELQQLASLFAFLNPQQDRFLTHSISPRTHSLEFSIIARTILDAD